MPSDVVVLAFMGLALVAALRLFGTRRTGDVGFRASDYRAKPLVTAWELRVLGEIGADLPCGYHACPQVRLADFIETCAVDPSLWRAAFNRVSRKSVDFAIMDPGGSVALVIELDDRSHGRPDRVRRDREVGAVLAHCGVPLVRVRPGQRVDVGRHLLTRRPRLAG